MVKKKKELVASKVQKSTSPDKIEKTLETFEAQKHNTNTRL